MLPGMSEKRRPKNVWECAAEAAEAGWGATLRFAVLMLLRLPGYALAGCVVNAVADRWGSG